MLNKREARLLHALKTRAGREKHGAFVVEGIRAVEDLARAGIDLKFAVTAPSLGDSRRGKALSEWLAANADVSHVSNAEFDALSDTETPQGVIVVAHTPDASLADIDPPVPCLVLVLDALQDPGNVGTLIRSADAFAAACVVALSGTVDYWNPKVVRSAAGSAFRVPLIAERAEALWRWLSEHQFVICGADARGVSVTSAPRDRRIALVVGNEGSGLRQETRSHLDERIAIPMPGRAESLNVAVAAGILLYELSRKHG